MSQAKTLPSDVKGMALGGIAGLCLGMVLGGGLSWVVGGMSTFSRMFFILHVCFAMVLTGIWTGPLFVTTDKAKQKESVQVADTSPSLSDSTIPRSTDTAPALDAVT